MSPFVSRVAVLGLRIAPGWGDCGAAEHDVGQEQSRRKLHEASLCGQTESVAKSSKLLPNRSQTNNNEKTNSKQQQATN